MDTKYLEKHGNQWRVQVRVPAKARSIIGKAKLLKPLHTDSLAQATRLEHRVVADFNEQIAKAIREVDLNCPEFLGGCLV
ncbi:MAG: DUF6538 domain-containing protein [Hyphomicrobiaceae bacterium]